MRRDYAAIVAVLALPWPQGQTEGQVTRLKPEMYGRDKLDPRHRRLVRPA
jgi:transposase